jgi:hypothetical protein
MSLDQTRHYVDIHLAPHVQNLTNLIRNWAVVLYFQPFATIRLDRMSTAFGWTVEEVEEQVVGLIQSGEIQGRVDSQNKVRSYSSTLSSNSSFLITRLPSLDLASQANRLPSGLGGQVHQARQRHSGYE